MPVSTPIAPTVQCPQCGSHSVVEYKPTVYRCLKCDFERDLNEPNPEDNGVEPAIWVTLGVGVLWLLLL